MPKYFETKHEILLAALPLRMQIRAKLFNRITAIGAHERQLFDKLLWGLVTSTIFVRC
jgi:hypothetical protein